MDLLAFMMVLPNVIAAVLGRVNKEWNCRWAPKRY